MMKHEKKAAHFYESKKIHKPCIAILISLFIFFIHNRVLHIMKKCCWLVDYRKALIVYNVFEVR